MIEPHAQHIGVVELPDIVPENPTLGEQALVEGEIAVAEGGGQSLVIHHQEQRHPQSTQSNQAQGRALQPADGLPIFSLKLKPQGLDQTAGRE